MKGQNKIFTLIRCKSDAEWLEQRKQGIGGSEVGAVMGLSPWKTPLQVWLEKTGREECEDISDNPIVKFGTDYEKIVGEHYKQENPSMTVRRVNALCKSIARPWAQASLDYEICDKLTKTWGVLEIKTARSKWDRIPDSYLCQVLHYLSVTGREYAHIHVFYRDSCTYETFLVNPSQSIEADMSDLQAVIDAVDEFWNEYVVKNVMPEATGSDGGALARMFADRTGDIVELDDYNEFDGLAYSYKDAQAQEKSAKDRKNIYAARIQQLIGANAGIESGKYKAIAIRSEREKFNMTMFRAEHPEMYAKYTKTEIRNGGIRIKEVK